MNFKGHLIRSDSDMFNCPHFEEHLICQNLWISFGLSIVQHLIYFRIKVLSPELEFIAHIEAEVGWYKNDGDEREKYPNKSQNMVDF